MPAQLRGSGDVPLQDLRAPGTAQPRLQGDFHLPGRPLPALRRHPADLHLQQAQHEAQGDGGLDLHGPQQQRGGGAEPLAGDEGLAGDTGLQVAHAAGVLVLARAACRTWHKGLSPHVLCCGKWVRSEFSKFERRGTILSDYPFF